MPKKARQARSKTPQTARTAAVAVLVRVLQQGRSLTGALPSVLDTLPEGRERAFASELCYGVLRWLIRLEAIIAELMERPLRRKDTDIRVVLLVGLYQLIYTRVPPHAAVGEAVDLCSRRGKPWAKGLVNSVLRGFERRRAEVLSAVDGRDTARYAHPTWLLAAMRRSWPERWPEIAAANNAPAPLTLRVNVQRTDRTAYLAALHTAGIDARAATRASEGIVVARSYPVERLPGFADGLVSVQDEAAQLAAGLLDAQPGQRVLDACAAPGGKTAHILERTAKVSCVAVESDAARAERLMETLRRLKLDAQVQVADAAEPESWWGGGAFDRILIDAPCTGTGAIRRRPDIKYHRRPEDLTALAEEQARLLDALWPLLAPGGRLLYATCSILAEENENQVRRFVEKHGGAVPCPITAEWGVTLGFGRQTLPGEEGMDGFYYALLEKRA